MASKKLSSSNANHVTFGWALTILSLALSSAALAVTLQQNNDLREELALVHSVQAAQE